MRIVTWNCNMAFRKKAEYILAYNPDIVVVPECEHPAKLQFPLHITSPSHTLWYGDNINKGLGIFAFGQYHIETLDCHNPEYKYVVPIRVSDGQNQYIVIAIWANNIHDKGSRYIEQVWKAIHHYDDLLNSNDVILIGDFNSNTIWDRKHKERCHSSVVNILHSKGITSVYHNHHKQKQGAEQHPTLYMYRNKEKSYHIDYCFASSCFSDSILAVEIGEPELWLKYSDHVPLMVSFDRERIKWKKRRTKELT